jgi:hypothetical protein
VSAAGTPPDGASIRYAVVPNVENAKFLLPLASARVTAASMLAYNALRPPKVRASRAVIGLLARVGLFTLLVRAPVLSVSVPAGVDPADVLLAARLSALLGRGRLHAAIGIRPPDPHHKPTLQLFDDRGVPQGYAKIGWNDGTRGMVRSEAATLRDLPAGDEQGFPDAPRLMHAADWHDQVIAVIEPMPRNVRRIRRPGVPRIAAMRAVARRGGPATAARPLGESTFLAALRLRAAGAGDEINAAIDAVAARDGALRFEFGDWHGDWVPWNMARHRGRLMVWDWENRAPDVPLGFDLAHEAFQTALSTRGLPAPAATTAMVDTIERYGAHLDLGPEQRRCIADAYLIELWLRTSELAAGGGGWNPKLHPALLHVLAERLALPAPA